MLTLTVEQLAMVGAAAATGGAIYGVMRFAYGVVGFAGGVSGGVSGLGPIVPGVWFGLRGMSKIEQRSLTQPFALVFFGAMAVILLARGAVSEQALEGLAVATPFMPGAAFLGLRGFERLSTSAFQRAVTALAILGAAVLLVRQLGNFGQA
jgi:hypothetical protein